MMKNPLMDAIKKMKADRVAIVVGDADELGLPDMAQMPGHEDMEMEGESEADPNEMEETDEPSMEASSEAEQMMGRKPFDKAKPAMKSGSEDMNNGEMPDNVAKELYDEDMVNKMRSSGKKPNGLFARAQANLAKRFNKD